MSLLTSNSSLLMEKSMQFLWTKQAAILDNIANAETPEYKPKVVTFEENLREKLENVRNEKTFSVSDAREAIESTSWEVAEQNEVTRMDDNGVNVTEQSVEMMRNAYQIQYVMSSISNDLTRLRSAITG